MPDLIDVPRGLMCTDEFEYIGHLLEHDPKLIEAIGTVSIYCVGL